jgi:formylglycine-generating enzyme required for sulfatase activity
MEVLRDNWLALVLVLMLIILALLAVIVRLSGGVARMWRAFVGALPFRHDFERAYLDLLLDTQSETPALLVKGDLMAIELLKAFATMRVQVEGAPESDAEPIEQERNERVYLGRQAWYRRLWQRWRARNECSQPPTTPGTAIWRQRRLVIRGKPGSGKTTLLKHIAITCAREKRGQATQRQPGGARTFSGTREIYGWPRPLLPIFIPLRRLARACPEWENLSLLDAYERGFGYIFGPSLKLRRPGWFRKRFAKGGCLLLIDGFDELRDELRRDRMAQLVRDLERISSKRPNYIVVTTRPIGYEGQLDNRFELRELAPLNRREVVAMVQARYAAIHERERSGRRLDWQPEEKAERLTSRLGQSASLLRLASNPLMLGLIIGIHHRQEDGELPQERYRVYELAVEYLTERWEMQRGRVAGEQLAHGALNLDEKRALAANLAWAMFNQTTDPVLQRAAAREQLDSYLLISRRTARDILAECMEPILSGRVAERGPALTQICRDQAQQWLIDLSERGGLLQGEGNDDSPDAPIQFAHKSIQEYLAAQAIGGDDDRLRMLLSKWENDDWREVLLLYAASQHAEKVIGHLLRQGTPKAQLLAGWCLYERPRHPPGVALQDEVRGAVRPLLLATTDTITADENSAALTIMEGIGSALLNRSLLEQVARQAISPVVRVRVVELLAVHAEYDTAVRRALAAVADCDPDYRPRLAAGRALAHGDPRYEGQGWIPELVEIPAGPFLMGSSDTDEQARSNERPQHELTLPTYWIGKTPVTNAQWRRFAEAGGYSNRGYWTDAGWAWRQGSDKQLNWRERLFQRRASQPKISEPGYWHDERFNADNQPVVGVSWFEAVAYCRWLSEATKQEFYLPSEAEWEKAARGPHGLIYPWGNEWQAGRCNDDEAGIGRPSPVGSFPEGASPYGALDMAGNVWEWCATKYGKPYPYDISEDEWAEAYLEEDDLRRLRGGGFWDDRTFVRGAYRSFDYYPRYRPILIGMRVARRSPRPDAEF